MKKEETNGTKKEKILKTFFKVLAGDNASELQPDIKQLMMGIIYKNDTNYINYTEFFKDEWKRSGHSSLGSYITYKIYDDCKVIRSPSEVKIYNNYNKYIKERNMFIVKPEWFILDENAPKPPQK